MASERWQRIEHVYYAALEREASLRAAFLNEVCAAGARLYVPVDPGTRLAPGRAQVLFDFAMLVTGAGNRPYDIAPDGRFLIIRSGQGEAGGISP